jgi:hypothetical protein
MSQRISIFELSERALDETLDKYSGALRGYGLSWTWCKICTEIRNIAIHENSDISDSDMCKLLCPLYTSKWCRNNRHDSKLSDTEQSKVEWLKNVERYLWWITIELELMRNDYEKHWGGAW